MDILSHIIADSVLANNWKPMIAGLRGPKISHLIFADDLLLFDEASLEQMRIILDCLHCFFDSSGQNVNPQKTSIVFSKNVVR